METIQPTTFHRSLTKETMNDEQLLCAKAVDAVIALNFFDADQFSDINHFPTNHLLKWCVEVLTVHEFGFFKGGSDWQNTLVCMLKYRFESLYLIGRHRSYH